MSDTRWKEGRWKGWHPNECHKSEKSPKEGGLAQKIKKFTIQNVDYFKMRGSSEFQIFPKIKLLKYSLDFDEVRDHSNIM